MAYVCEAVEIINGIQTCVMWVQFNPSWLDELNNLTRNDVNNILIEIAGFWLLCWGYRILLKFLEK